MVLAKENEICMLNNNTSEKTVAFHLKDALWFVVEVSFGLCTYPALLIWIVQINYVDFIGKSSEMHVAMRVI